MSDGELQKLGTLLLATGALQLAWGTALVLWSKPLKGIGGVMQRFGVGFVLAGAVWYFEPFGGALSKPLGNELSLQAGVALFAIGGLLGLLLYRRVRGEMWGK